MSGYITFPQNRIHKKEEAIKLNPPRNFTESFYKYFLDGIDFSQDNNFQQQPDNNSLHEDVKNFLLATNNFGEEIQGELDLYITNNGLNKASFKRRLDPNSKNIKTRYNFCLKMQSILTHKKQ